ncbi:hypothetical protein ACFO26_05905 [Lactococcus nasutitermitis]|uniref:Uncharacterized protein n=1 Tax=Lactococcus nasutitermitis TaxID=1652957 RepID=A0ABV9JCN5_9LACT|nr:hypothetical protein [Lactococcus nasutitermitis]
MKNSADLKVKNPMIVIDKKDTTIFKLKILKAFKDKDTQIIILDPFGDTGPLLLETVEENYGKR